MILSATPVTVPSWGVFQLFDVNVKESGLTVTSFVFDEAISKTTLELGWGWDVNTIVNVSVVPASVTVADVLLSVKPATPPEPPSTSTNSMSSGIPESFSPISPKADLSKSDNCSCVILIVFNFWTYPNTYGST